MLWLLQLCLLLGLYLLHVSDAGPEGVLPRHHDRLMMQNGVETRGSWVGVGLTLCVASPGTTPGPRDAPSRELFGGRRRPPLPAARPRLPPRLRRRRLRLGPEPSQLCRPSASLNAAYEQVDRLTNISLYSFITRSL